MLSSLKNKVIQSICISSLRLISFFLEIYCHHTPVILLAVIEYYHVHAQYVDTDSGSDKTKHTHELPGEVAVLLRKKSTHSRK